LTGGAKRKLRACFFGAYTLRNKFLVRGGLVNDALWDRHDPSIGALSDARALLNTPRTNGCCRCGLKTSLLCDLGSGFASDSGAHDFTRNSTGTQTTYHAWSRREKSRQKQTRIGQILLTRLAYFGEEAVALGNALLCKALALTQAGALDSLTLVNNTLRTAHGGGIKVTSSKAIKLPRKRRERTNALDK
jgi:hypothetical protein